MVIQKYNRQWDLKAKTKKDFNEWVYNIRKACRPCWVEESAAQCWVSLCMSLDL